MPSPRSLLGSYLALALVWGSSFLFIAIAVTGLPPELLTWLRLALGGGALALVAWLRNTPWPRGGRAWGQLAILGLLLSVVPILAFSWAGQYLPSGLSSILNATIPLLTVLFALGITGEPRPGPRALVGLLLGIVGVVLVFAPWQLTSAPLLPQLACLGGAASYALGLVWLRRFVQPLRLDPLMIATGQALAGAVVLIPLVPATIGAELRFSPAVIGSVLVLGLLASGAAYVWNAQLTEAWGAARTSTVTYLIPVVAIALGAVFNGERLEPNELLGGLVVVVGVVFSSIPTGIRT